MNEIDRARSFTAGKASCYVLRIGKQLQRNCLHRSQG